MSARKEDTMRFPRFSGLGRAGPRDVPGLVSRRRFFGASAGAAGAVLGSGLWTPAHSSEHGRDDEGEGGQQGAACAQADPIPHLNAVISGFGFGAFHVFFPGPADGSAAPSDPEGVHPDGRDPSTIFNFDGVIGQAELNLTGTGTDTTTGQSAPYQFHTDMRFMAGKFVGTDGLVHKGAFAFI